MTTVVQVSARALALVVFGVVLGTLLAVPTTARAEEHQLFLFVMNQYGLAVEDLQAGEVTIEASGDACEVKTLQQGNAPMRVALIVDNSDAAAQSLNPLRQGLRDFLTALPEEHEVGLFTISGQTQQLAEFTTDRAALTEQVDNLFVERGTGVLLLDGMVETWDRRFEDSDAWPVFVTVVHDGAEASRSVRERQFNEFVEELRARAATVHAILVSSRRGTSVQTDVSINITKNTGGLYRSLAAATALPTALAELASRMGAHYEEVKARYRVVFECEDDNPGRVRARVDRPAVAVRTFSDRSIEP